MSKSSFYKDFFVKRFLEILFHGIYPVGNMFQTFNNLKIRRIGIKFFKFYLFENQSLFVCFLIRVKISETMKMNKLKKRNGLNETF